MARYAAEMPTIDASLQEMLDEFALRKLVHAYCRAVDRGDFATLRDLYHEDAVDAHGEFSTGSVDEFLDELAAVPSTHPVDAAQHHHRELRDQTATEPRARSTRSRCTRSVRAIGMSMSSSADAISTSTRSGDDTWKIVERTIVTDWAQVTIRRQAT